jgi:hypothetical protein
LVVSSVRSYICADGIVLIASTATDLRRLLAIFARTLHLSVLHILFNATLSKCLVILPINRRALNIDV